MIKAKSKMIDPTSEAAASEVFAVADNIIPIRIASVDEILKLKDVDDLQVVPEKRVKRLIVENKTTNPMSKFFVKMGTYLDSMEGSLTEMHSNYLGSIEQKKSLYHTEESDQSQRTSRAKRAAKNISDKRKSNSPLGIDAVDDILGLLGLNYISNLSNNTSNEFDGQIFKETVREGGFAVGSGSNVSVSPKWIPFPKGTTGLTFTSGFGQRPSPGGIGSTNHKGIDIAGRSGTPIITPISGVVDVFGPLGSYGNVVFVRSGNTVMEFGHLKSINVRSIGEELQAGQVIGTMGNTGNSTGVHLHWTIRVNGVPVDPVQWTQTNDPLAPTTSFTTEEEQEPLDNESEGGINRFQRIMTGEAGTEFVIPASQMPVFSQLMLEEKIKSLDPFYNPPYGRFNNLGVKRQSGFSNTMLAGGGISGAVKFIKKHEGLGAFTPGTGGGNRLADYIGEGMSTSVKGTPRSKAYNASTNLFSYIDTEGVDTLGYGTTFYDDIFGGNQPVKRGDTSTVGKMESIMHKHVKQIYDQYDEWYPLFKYFKPNQQAGIISYLYNRGPNAIVGYGPMRRAIKAGNVHELADEIEIDTASVGPKRRKEEADLLRTGPSKIVGPKIVGPKKVGEPSTVDYILKFFSGNKQSSLNSIPDNQQMQIANETQEQFSFDNAGGEIVALYQPTVYYEV